MAFGKTTRAVILSAKKKKQGANVLQKNYRTASLFHNLSWKFQV